MITYGLNYDVRPGREAEFETRFRAIMEALSGFPGHRETRLFRDVVAPASYMVYSEWNSRDAFGEFIRSDAFAATKTWGREEILSAQPRHSILSERDS